MSVRGVNLVHPRIGPVSRSESDQTGPRAGVDVGGTFTDLVYSDGESLRVVKVPSTPPDFERGVAHALQGLLEDGTAASGPGRRGIELIHGSTIATNALLERKTAPIAFITTAGFRDLLHIGRQNRPELYNLHVRRPAPIVPRERCFTVNERIGAGGEVIVPLDEGPADDVARRIVEAGLRNVAICLLFSFANAAHERRVGEICRARGLTVTLSSEVMPEFREYERASTTAITAALRPTVEAYFARLRAALPGIVRDVRILHGGGGTYPIAEAAANAGRLVLSGPAGGAAGAAMIARLAGYPDAVGFDMGGTSTDVTLIKDGRPHFAQQHSFDGLPVHLPMLDTHTVGAGGGSIAFIDAGGSLRVGPRSAGAQPGPACYGRGGTEPTVTDANVVLGRIPTDARFGELQLRANLARSALEALAAQLGMSPEQAALGILKVAEQNMAGAVRVVTAQRGHDPRRLALVSFGGAGGLHACAVAELLGMSRVILPPMAGVLSALGMVAAADSVDVSQTTLQLERAGQLDDARLGGEFARLDELVAPSPRDEARPLGAIELFADCRWAGQSHELTVAVAEPTRASISARFAELYAGTYGPPPPGRNVEIVTLRLRRSGRAPRILLPPVFPTPAAAQELRLINNSGLAVRACGTSRAPLVERVEMPGPFLLIDPDATAFVPAGWLARARPDGIVIAHRATEAT